jgi:hypothetical protein
MMNAKERSRGVADLNLAIFAKRYVLSCVAASISETSESSDPLSRYSLPSFRVGRKAVISGLCFDGSGNVWGSPSSGHSKSGALELSGILHYLPM